MPENTTETDVAEKDGTEKTGIISSTELKISTVKSSQVSNLTKIWSRRIINLVEGTSLGLGTFTLAYNLTENLDPVVSYLTRVGVGGGVGTAFVLASSKLDDYLGESGFKQLYKKGDSKKAVIRTLHTTAGVVAFWGFLPTLNGITNDIGSNKTIEEETAVKVEDMKSYKEDPRVLPATIEIGARFQSDIISSLSSDGNITPEAMAKMALYNDGERVEWDPNFLENLDFERSWDIDHNGEKWTVLYLNPESWVVSGPKLSWWVGVDANGRTVKDEFEYKFGKQKSFDELRKILNNSGKIDGKPAIEDLVGAVDSNQELTGSFGDGEKNLLALAPFEWNQAWREKVRINNNELKEEILEQKNASVWIADEKLFGVTALSIPDSYASARNSIELTK